MELKFKAENEKPVTLQRFLEKQGVSRRLLIRLKQQEHGIIREPGAEALCRESGKNENNLKSKTSILNPRSIDLVYKGDIIILDICDDRFLQPNRNLNAEVVFENESIAVFNKPPNMPVHPSVKHQGDTLGNYFAYLYPGITFRPINRLDRDTSGLCAVAKNPHSANVLQGNIKKVYYAAVEGRLALSGTIDAPIARLKDSIIVRCIHPDGQRAVTHYESIKYSVKHTLVRVRLETGRTHQIRVHFSYIEHPLAGDDMYGGSHEFIQRQALHCGSLIFNDPVTGEGITVKIPLSEDIAILVNN